MCSRVPSLYVLNAGASATATRTQNIDAVVSLATQQAIDHPTLNPRRAQTGARSKGSVRMVGEHAEKINLNFTMDGRFVLDKAALIKGRGLRVSISGTSAMIGKPRFSEVEVARNNAISAPDLVTFLTKLSSKTLHAFRGKSHSF